MNEKQFPVACPHCGALNATYSKAHCRSFICGWLLCKRCQFTFDGAGRGFLIPLK